MPTLYELLEALPEDDADGLRRAFRKAAKANHPDNNPDDPDAPQRFRRIVRAHAILQDEAQRATYDASLAKAQRQQALTSKRKSVTGFRSLLPHAISGVVIAFVSIGAFLLIENLSRTRIAPTHVQGVSVPASALAAAMPTPPSEPATVGRAGERDRPGDVTVIDEPRRPDAAKEIVAPVAVASADNTVVVPAVSDAVKNARYYRERGGLAYRGGDLPLALIDFDLAIYLDPNFADAYVDRAIVFRRMGDQKRALADVAQVKRIDEFKLQQTASP